MDRKLTTALLMLALCLFALPGPAWAAEDGGLGLSTILTGIAVAWAVGAAGVFYNPRMGTVLTGLMALGVSIYLGAQHGQSGDMICGVDDTFDCGAIVRSEYSALFGIPIAFLGSAFYAGAAAVGLSGIFREEQTRNGGRWLLWTGGASVLYSAFLAYVSHSVLGKWCLFCISLYGFNTLLAIAGYMWNQAAAQAPETEESDTSLQTMLSAGAVVFIAVMLIANNGSSSSTPTPSDVAANPTSLASLFEATGGAMTLDGSEPILGDPTAAYTLVEFADFECPYCGQVSPELKDLIGSNPDVRLLYKHYPISSICNENVGREGHVNACGAAKASECARQQQRFWDLSRMMYMNQRNLTDSDLRFMAQQVNLNMDAFESCMADPVTETAIRTDVAHATQIGVSGTPTLFLKGVQGDEWVRVRGGPAEALTLINAHRNGIALPPTPAAQPM
ncbi:MAG: vitamin K epoxide reductase family protein [Myxococcota bacterium]